MKKIIFLLVLIICTSEVSAINTTQTFDDVFITFEDDEGNKTISAVNYITDSAGVEYYKLYFGEVNSYNYVESDEEIIKSYYESFLNRLIYCGEVFNETEESKKWYYIVQLKIYDYIYSDYEVYFSDETGVANDYLSSEIEIYQDYRGDMTKEEVDLEIYNNEKIEADYTSVAVSSNVSVTKYDDAISAVIQSGSTGKIFLTKMFNVDGESKLYINNDENILFVGGGSFSKEEVLSLTLENEAVVSTDNPATGGSNPYVILFVGIPVIITGTLIYCLANKNKKNN